ncbi:MAG TPA: methyltransferase domain-containing protein [Woeseiaceae bacterium]|nr:methyltransferase domain-containing protein [Woeseiaceae bacterium]
MIKQIYGVKGRYVCNEICRDEDPTTVEQRIRNDLLSYLSPEELAGKRVLDFGCGCGASTMVLARLLPRDCEIIGIELQEQFLKIARLRARHFGHKNVRFLRSPCGSRLPEEIGAFHCVIFSAVFEHLFSKERNSLVPRIWFHLEPGGTLFINQTPHRYSPFEAHTTGLPLINYLPDKATHFVATRFSKRIPIDDTWETLLRKGIRGGTANEVLEILRRAGGSPALLAPAEPVGDRIDLWYRGLSPRYAWLKRSIWAALKISKLVTRIEMAPVLALAIRKGTRGATAASPSPAGAGPAVIGKRSA